MMAVPLLSFFPPRFLRILTKWTIPITQEKMPTARTIKRRRGDPRRRGSGEVSDVGESSGVSAARGEGENGAAEGEFEQLFLFMLGRSGAGGQAPLSDSREEGVVGWTRPASRSTPMRFEDE